MRGRRFAVLDRLVQRSGGDVQHHFIAGLEPRMQDGPAAARVRDRDFQQVRGFDRLAVDGMLQAGPDRRLLALGVVGDNLAWNHRQDRTALGLDGPSKAFHLLIARRRSLMPGHYLVTLSPWMREASHST